MAIKKTVRRFLVSHDGLLPLEPTVTRTRLVTPLPLAPVTARYVPTDAQVKASLNKKGRTDDETWARA